MFELLREETRKEWINLKRYPLNTLGYLITMYALFLVAFLGIKMIPGSSPAFADNFLVNYILWSFCMAMFQSITSTISSESMLGTLQKMFLSRYPVLAIFLTRAVVSIFFNAIILVSLALLATLTTGKSMEINWLLIVQAMLISAPSIWGMGMILGALALLAKRIGSLMMIMNFVLVAFVAVDSTKNPVFMFLPFATAADYAQSLSHGGIGDTRLLLIAAVNSAVYLVLGSVIFLAAVRAAKEKNLLSEY